MKDKRHVYIISLFLIADILWVDTVRFGLSINVAAISVATMAALVFNTWDTLKNQKPMFGSLAHLDAVVYAIGILALISLIWKVIFNPIGYAKEVQIITLTVMYYLLNGKNTVAKNQIMAFSIFGMIMNVVLLWHYLVDESFDFLIQAAINDNIAATWLVLMIAVNSTAYCIDSNKQLWHGFNAVVGFFLLLMQKNIPSMIAAGMLFIIIPLVYTPKKQLIKRNMQLFFIYAFMACNMTLLTECTDICDEALTYDLGTSVYLELALAVFGIAFFRFWDRLDENEKENIKKAHVFWRKMLIALFILTAAFTVSLIKGNSSIVPEAFDKLIAETREGFASNRNIFVAAGNAYGVFGVCVVAYFLYNILESLKKQKRMKATRQQKLLRVITLMYVLQSFLLTQSMPITAVYLVFVIACINSTRTPIRVPKEEKDYETDNTDTLLQRSADTGDSAE